MLSPASPQQNETETEAQETTETQEQTTEVGPDQDQGAETAAPEARGSTTEVVVPKKRKIVHVIENDRLCGLLLKAEDGTEIKLDRPTDRNDVHYSLWVYADKQRRSANERAEDSQRFAAMMKIGNEPRSNSVPRPRIQLPPPPPLAANMQPAQLGVPVAETGDPALRWQTKELSEEIRTELENRWVIKIEEHTHDKSGRLFTPGGTKGASFCGRFPHAITKPKVGPHRDQNLYLVGGTFDVGLRITLHHRGAARTSAEVTGDPVSESEVLQELRDRLPKEEIATWGSFESSMIFYAELQFDQSIADSAAAKIKTDPASPQCAFRQAPENGKLLKPAETTPYAGGPYEQMMTGGEVFFQFQMNNNVTSSNLSDPYHSRKFRLAVWCLNPYLNKLESFRALSLPFAIKSTLHNSLKCNERYVLSDGPNSLVIPCPRDQIASFAGQHRRRRKRKQDDQAADDDQEA